ncbi:Protein ALTERED XYLOGLUCAN 4-like [Hirschfeldia incana]|nr:Protein ALTERED XYLOGLUCAN 4-like [Hirschfeldia incana]
MKSISASPEISEKTERWIATNLRRLSPFLLSSFCITLFSTCFFVYQQNPFKTIFDQDDLTLQPQIDPECDLFKGHWVPNKGGSLYTNASCSTIPDSKNCIKHGRSDRNFLFWRWKPDGCDLPRFNPKAFLSMVRGKKMSFIGDSVARNHMESLLCLLSTEESPKDIYKDVEDRNRIWYFPSHDFTLSTSWTKFLVAGQERIDGNKTGTGLFDIDIAKMDEGWSKGLPNTDIAIVSAAHWFFRPIIIHRGNETLGCIYCNLPNTTQITPDEGFKLVYSAVFKHISECKNCKEDLATVLRTISPSHFVNGTWDTGGACSRTSPFGENQIDLQSYEMKIKTTQIQQLEGVTKGDYEGKKFTVLDVTKVMLMRPDGHPNRHWGNKWMKGYNDCVHWCLPGPIDVWSEFLMAIVRQLI